MDGDGDRELIATSTDQVGYVSIRPNNGDGTFAPRTDYELGNSTNTAAAADIDADGDNDLAVGGSTVWVLFNNGDATFVPVEYGSFGISVLLFDFDGDGDRDLAYAKPNGPANGWIAIRKNDGSGTFDNEQKYEIGVATNSISASDLDGDGDLDISAANSGWNYPPTGNSVSVLKNNGDGTFAPKIDYPGGTTPTGIVAFDANQDFYTDLVVTDNFSNSLGVLLNKGDGTFHTKVDYGAGQNPGTLAASDFDLDGNVDLAVVNYGSSKVKVLKNLGGVPPVPPTPLLGDLNNDGNHTPTDAMLMINCVFLASGFCGMAYTDVNCDGDLSVMDTVLELNKVFLGTPFPCGP